MKIILLIVMTLLFSNKANADPKSLYFSKQCYNFILEDENENGEQRKISESYKYSNLRKHSNGSEVIEALNLFRIVIFYKILYPWNETKDEKKICVLNENGSVTGFVPKDSFHQDN